MTRTCVIYNPAAGRGKAEKLIRELAPSDIELRASARPEHAIELARAAADEGFDRVVAAGGDGTVHEVANGLVQSANRDVVFSAWPFGSANDYAFTLGLAEHWKRRAENLPTETIRADVGRVSGGGRERFYVNSVGVGFNGMVGLEAKKIRWLRGMPLYTWAFLKAMVKHFATPQMTIRFDGAEQTVPTLALTVNLAQREGGFPLTPHARIDDGLFDYMHATKLRRWHLLRFLPGMATGNLPTDHPLVRLGRAAKIEMRSETPLFVHTDGEFFCVPSDGVKEVTMEVLPGRLKVEVYRPAMYGKWK